MYLERNAAILREVAENQSLDLVKIIRENGGRAFAPAGTIYSPTLGQEVFVGIKFPIYADSPYEEPSRQSSKTEDRATEELAFLATIARELPHLTSELPIFYGLVRNRSGATIGIVEEDFSEGGTFEVEEARVLVTEVNRMLGDGPKAMLGVPIAVAFMVNGQRRLGDFHGFFFDGSFFPEQHIKENIQDYTVTVDYELE